MNILKVAVFVFTTGALVFLMKANFSLDSQAWDTSYFIWAKGKDVLFFGAILVLLKAKDRWLIRPLLFYSLINLLWELIRPMTNWDVNHPLMVTIIFTILLLGVIVWLLKDLRDLTRRDL